MSQELLNLVLVDLRALPNVNAIAKKAKGALASLTAVESLYKAFEMKSQPKELENKRLFLDSIVNGYFKQSDFGDQILFGYLDNKEATIGMIVQYLTEGAFDEVLGYLGDLVNARKK